MKSANEILRVELDNYLEGKGAEGGYQKEFQHHVLKDVETHPDKYRGCFSDMVAKAAASVWNSEPPASAQPDLFEIGGVRIDNHIAFPDESVPGGFRKVIQKHATVYHLHESVRVAEENARKVVQRLEQKKHARDVALERAGGNFAARLADLADAPVREAAA